MAEDKLTLEEKAIRDWKNDPALQQRFGNILDYYETLKSAEIKNNNGGDENE